MMLLALLRYSYYIANRNSCQYLSRFPSWHKTTRCALLSTWSDKKRRWLLLSPSVCAISLVYCFLRSNAITHVRLFLSSSLISKHINRAKHLTVLCAFSVSLREPYPASSSNQRTLPSIVSANNLCASRFQMHRKQSLHGFIG